VHLEIPKLIYRHTLCLKTFETPKSARLQDQKKKELPIISNKIYTKIESILLSANENAPESPERPSKFLGKTYYQEKPVYFSENVKNCSGRIFKKFSCHQIFDHVLAKSHFDLRVSTKNIFLLMLWRHYPWQRNSP